MNADMSVQLGDVQETLLIPLYFRAKETRRDAPLFRDPHAVHAVQNVDYDFTGFDAAWALEADVVVRTVLFDRYVRDHIVRHPNGQIINLGAGLDARLWRLDNGKIDWADLDMPDSMRLRERWLPSHPRHQALAQSMFDDSWLEAFDAERPTLIVAEALMFYFPESDVRQLMNKIVAKFVNGEMVVQTVAPGIVGKQSTVPLLRQTRAELRWGIHSGAEFEMWNPTIRFLSEQCLVDHHRERWRWYRPLRYVPGIGSYLREVMKISHLRFHDAERSAST